MSEHAAEISWKRDSETFTYDQYNREHRWRFPGGSGINASAAPQFKGLASHVNPEEAFVAACASCHMLTFLAICARKRLVVNSYNDSAVGFLEKNERGKLAITRIELSPKISFDGQHPDSASLNKMHEHAHRECFIANSVQTEIVVARTI
ncbi:MAG: OsmC family peroxiredoxin [Xanthomonadales bacterium]|nr:OsmC family peroxiredoxin [Xanthomonadales bacterium]